MVNRKYGIVVVSYKNPGMTTRFITQELSKLTDTYTLIVVNVCASKEESLTLASECGLGYVESIDKTPDRNHSKYIISVEENLGYARGNNLGVQFLSKHGHYTHFLFSNDDIEIRDIDILSQLADTMDLVIDVAGIGPRVVGLDGNDQSPHNTYISPYRLIAWRLFPLFRARRKPNISQTYPKQTADYCYWVSGAFMMVKAIDFINAGMFDNRTFLYHEEVILAERFLRMGKSFYFCPKVTVIHYEGGSSNVSSKLKRNIEMDSKMLYYKDYKNVNFVIRWLCRFICE